MVLFNIYSSYKSCFIGVAGCALCGGMDDAEQTRYVAQLKEEFDGCDTTGTGYLDKEELTVLCHRLNLDAHFPLLLDVLLGSQHYARVIFFSWFYHDLLD